MVFIQTKKRLQLVSVNIFLKPRKILHLLLKRRRDLIPIRTIGIKSIPILKD
jgi:hypothetical protein